MKFNKKMMLNYIALLLVLAGSFSSCKNNDLPEEKAIVGKWELISQGISEDKMTPVESNGSYSDFFSDGTMGYYNSTTGETNVTGNYRIQSDSLIYNYDKTYEQGRYDYKYEFANSKKQLKLIFVQGIRQDIYPSYYIFIYQRIK